MTPIKTLHRKTAKLIYVNVFLAQLFTYNVYKSLFSKYWYVGFT